MTTQHTRRLLDQLLDTALDLSPDDVPGFLRDRCPAHLRGRLASLLEIRDETGLIDLAPYAGGLVPELAEEAPELKEGECLGGWRVLGKIAEGGMGFVYLAERTDEPRKRAALKVARRHGEQVAKRFRLEKEILASFDRPDVVRFHDDGVTDDGRPYLVMDLVGGEHLDEASDERRLSVAERLRLFLAVCRAVEGVHRQGVVHRDLKPANVLVTGDGRVVLLDFGIAKRIDSTVGHGETAVEAMTPNFASPEQFLGGPVTPATDVYQLGILLYLLLVGELPHRLLGRGPAQAMAAVCEEQPRRPSQVFAAPAAPWDGDLAERARRRSATVRELRGALSEELDRIVLKALDKEPEGRYRSVRDLMDAVETHLDGPTVALDLAA